MGSCEIWNNPLLLLLQKGKSEEQFNKSMEISAVLINTIYL